MFVFGHLGIGRLVVGPRGRALPFVPLLLGMLLPDLIDKPLYYAHVSSFISCTRTFGHTGLFLIVVLLAATVRRSNVLLAIGIGMASHLALDCAMDLWSNDIRSAWVALAWPFAGWHFSVYRMTVADHLKRIFVAPVMVTELVGLTILVWEYWRWRRAAL
jgi:hypothetical protein